MKDTIIKIPQPLVFEGKEWKPHEFVAVMRHIFKSEFGRFPTPPELASFSQAFLDVALEENIN